jgi:hypothetical protein
MDSLLTTVYINYILSDTNVSLVEVWENRLFIWKYKGSPTIATSLGLEYKLPIYYRSNEYKQLSKKYHPDLSNSKSPRVLSGDIQKSINDSRIFLEEQNRGYAPEQYSFCYGEFDRIVSSKNSGTRANLTRELSGRLYDRSRMVQDRFSINHNSFASLLQEVVGSEVWGQDFKNVVQNLSRESKDRNRQDTIRKWNKPSSRPDAKKNNYTRYGAAAEYEQRTLRQEYGDVFRVHVGN